MGHSHACGCPISVWSGLFVVVNTRLGGVRDRFGDALCVWAFHKFGLCVCGKKSKARLPKPIKNISKSGQNNMPVLAVKLPLHLVASSCPVLLFEFSRQAQPGCRVSCQLHFCKTSCVPTSADCRPELLEVFPVRASFEFCS